MSSFGSKLIGGATDIASVSTLGSQIFGSSEISFSLEKEAKTREERKERAKKERASIMEQLRCTTEITEESERQSLALVMARSEEKSRTPSARSEEKARTPSVGGTASLSPEDVAEKELQARVNYIQAAKEHQALKKHGVSTDGELWMQSEKKLRDCYAQVEFWESMTGEASQDSRAPSNVLAGRDPKKVGVINFDQEEQLARDAYISAMMHSQHLANQRTSTSSEEWKAAQVRLHDCLANLQYWEGRRGYAVPPTV